MATTESPSQKTPATVMDRLKNFGFLLKDLSRRHVLRFEQRAAAISLTLNQCKVLVHLEQNEGINQARLAELTDVEPMTMVRILDRMETDQLIERRPDPVDRRMRRLYLTDKGKPRVAQVWHLAELTRCEMFEGVSDKDREVFMRVLEQLHASAGALTGQPVDPTEAAPAPAADPKCADPVCAEPISTNDDHGSIRTKGSLPRRPKRT
jgi:DNA-binding MarR family transcriptional regulator